jgi:hypothetical protein
MGLETASHVHATFELFCCISSKKLSSWLTTCNVPAGILAEVKESASEACSRLLDNLKKRIKSDDVMAAFEALHTTFFQAHSLENPEALRGLVKSKLEILKSYYGEIATTAGGVDVPALINQDDLDEEFDSFFTRLSSAATHGQSTKEAWKNIFVSPAVSKHMKSFCLLAKIMLCMPVTSVENERSFSLMNLLKDEKRNRMGSELLNCLSRIKSSSYSTNSFPYEALLQVWLKSGRYGGQDC